MLVGQVGGHGARGQIVRLVLAATFAAVGCDAQPPASGPTATAPAPSAIASPSPAIPTLTKVTLEPARAERAVLGPGGGVIEVTDTAGTSYVLEIPPGALWQEMPILAAPLNSIAGLPGAAEVAAGVHLEPEGLVLRAAATLTIVRAAPLQRATIAFAYAADLVDPHLYPAPRNSQTAVLRIARFSGYGLLQATEPATTVEELARTIPWELPDGASARALGTIAAALDRAGAGRTQAINLALAQWLDDGLAPLGADFGAMATWDDAAFFDLGLRIRSELALWDYVSALATLTGVTIDSLLETRISNLAVAAGTHAIEVTNAACGTSPVEDLALVRIPDIVQWLTWAAQRGLSARDPLLGADHVARNLCAAVRFLPAGGVVFPDSLRPGETGTLALAIGLQVDGEVEVHAIGTYGIEVIADGTASEATTVGTTDGVGRWTGDFSWASAAAGLRLEIRACLPAPLDAACAVATVVRGAAPASPSRTTSPSALPGAS
jgi:hypothetical protein